MPFFNTIIDNHRLIIALIISVSIGCYALKQAIIKPSYKMKIFYMILLVMTIMSISIVIDAWHDKTLPIAQDSDIIMENTAGQDVNIAALSQHQPVIIYFWGSWCHSCRLITPSVSWLSHQYPTIGVAVMSGSNEEMRHYLDSHRPNYWIVNDPNKRISHQWHVSKAPTILVIYKNQIRFVTQGLVSPVGLWLRVWLAKQS